MYFPFCFFVKSPDKSPFLVLFFAKTEITKSRKWEIGSKVGRGARGGGMRGVNPHSSIFSLESFEISWTNHQTSPVFF